MLKGTPQSWSWILIVALLSLLPFPTCGPVGSSTDAASSPEVSPLTITTTSLSSGNINRPYEAVLSAQGGVTPYRWFLTSGQLPPGLKLDSGGGRINGTPTQGGEFALTFEVRDSQKPSSAVIHKRFTLDFSECRLDRYGGLADAPVSGGATGFFRVAKVRDRWVLATPEGHAFYMMGVYNISGLSSPGILDRSYDDIVRRKYGDREVVWGLQQIRRLKSWGFNTVGPYSIRYVSPSDKSDRLPGDQSGGGRMPEVVMLKPSYYSLRNAQNLARGAVKDIIRGTDSHYRGYRAAFPDVFDPNLADFLDGQIRTAMEAGGLKDSPWVIGWMIDDTDNLNGFGAGPDFPDITPPGKANRHLGWIALITSPVQDTNPTWQVRFKDTKVYTKYALRDFLRSRYATIGALNRAWDSTYSTFDSDGGWGKGGGLLDEDGRHTGWVGTDPVYLKDANAKVKEDLDDFLLVLSDKYFRTCRDRLKAHSPNTLYLGPSTMGSWGTPPRREVLMAAGRYVDLASANLNVEDSDPFNFFVQYLGDKPMAYWLGRTANADSAMWRYRSEGGSDTQVERAQYYASQVKAQFDAVAPSAGVKPSVGFLWWEFHDNWGEKANWGLVTLSDNAYDGQEAMRSGGKPGVVGSATCKDSWGYPCGAEERDYGDFISTVRATNRGIVERLTLAFRNN